MILDGDRPLASFELRAGTPAVATLRHLDAGTRPIRATYSGDASHAPSRSETQNLPVTASPSTTLVPAPQPSFGRGSRVWLGVAKGDFNGDGFLDLATANGSFGAQGVPPGNDVTILLGDGRGAFNPAPGSPVRVGDAPTSIVASDFTQDSVLDLATANADGTVTVLRGDGRGGFVPAPASPLRTASGATLVESGDFDRDGRVDLVTVGFSGFQIHLGRGDGTFSSRDLQSAPFGFGSPGVFVTDFTRDGVPDLVIGVSAPVNQVQFWTEVAPQRWSIVRRVDVAANPNYMTAADWNQDGHLDFASVGSGNGVVTFVLSRVDGHRSLQFNPFVVPSTMLSIAPMDVNGDGSLDALVGRPPALRNEYTEGLGIVLGNGRGEFGANTAVRINVSIWPRAMATGDFNNDGRQDLAVNDDADRSVRVFLGVQAAKLIPGAGTTPQVTRVNTEFATPLSAQVLDTEDRPIAGVGVLYAYPRSGAAQPGLQVPVNTTGVIPFSDANGQTSLTVRANGVAGGPYELVASVGRGPETRFRLTNLPPGTGSTVNLSTARSTILEGELIQLRATVQPTTATGTVDFLDATTVLGTAEVTRGQAVLLKGDFAPGTRRITARYRGDPAFEGSTSTAVNLIVQTRAGANPSISGAGSVVNGASLRPGLAGGTWITLYGTNLSTVTRTWESRDFDAGALPTSLDGVRVNIQGVPAFVFFISPSQINVLAPKNLPPGPAAVQVIRGTALSSAVNVTAQALSPALFAYAPQSGRYAVAQDATNFALIGPPGLLGEGVPLEPAREGQVLTVYATGLGDTDPPYEDGVLSAAAPLAAPLTLRLGGVAATTTYAGRISPGLYQVNFIVPAGLSGDAEITLLREGTASPTGVFLAIR